MRETVSIDYGLLMIDDWVDVRGCLGLRFHLASRSTNAPSCIVETDPILPRPSGGQCAKQSQFGGVNRHNANEWSEVNSNKQTQFRRCWAKNAGAAENKANFIGLRRASEGETQNAKQSQFTAGPRERPGQ